MKILMIGWFFYPKPGGVETLMFEQAKFFLQKGAEVFVLTSKGDFKEKEDIDGIKVIRKDYLSTTQDYPLEKLKTDFNLLLSKIKPDIVHFHNGSYPPATTDRSIGTRKILMMLELLRAKQIKIIEHAHNAQLRQAEITKPLRDFNWDCVICVSEFVKKKWLELGTGAQKLQMIYNGIDLKRYQNIQPNQLFTGLKKDRKIIFFPSRLISMTNGGISTQKNFMLILNACKILIKKGFKDFLLIGICNETNINQKVKDSLEFLKKMVKDSGLVENVIFIEPIKASNMPEYYSASDIICSPSIDETFGLVYLEAMASGKIAIASNTGAPKEYIQNGKNGFLTDPSNSKDLSEILINIIGGKINVQLIGQEAIKTAQRFSIESACKKISNIYKELIES